MAAVSICSDFVAPKNKVCHCFHCFPTYCPGSPWKKMKVLSYPVLSDFYDRTDCSMPDSVHGISQAGILEWVASPLSRVSSLPRDQTQISCIAGRLIAFWALREACSLFITELIFFFFPWHFNHLENLLLLEQVYFISLVKNWYKWILIL